MRKHLFVEKTFRSIMNKLCQRSTRSCFTNFIVYR